MCTARDAQELYETLLRGLSEFYHARGGCIALPTDGRVLRLYSDRSAPTSWSTALEPIDVEGRLVISIDDGHGAAAVLALDADPSASARSCIEPLVPLTTTLLRTLRVRGESSAAVKERETQELKLREVEAFVEAAQRISRTGSWTWDPTDATSGEWSPETYAMLGYDPTTTRASFEANVARIHPDDRARYLEVVQATAARGHDLDVEYRYLLPDGAIRHVHARGKRISATLYIGTANDITERRTAEAAIRKAHSELAAASRLTTLGELVASLSHELNQPFTAAVANAGAARRWLNREPPDIVRATRSMDALMEDARRAQTIIASLRAMARKSEPERHAVDIDEAIVEVAALALSELEMQGAELRLHLNSERTPMLVDRVQLQQVILTLLMTCLERTGEHQAPAKVVEIHSSWTSSDALLIAIEGFAPLALPSPLNTTSNLRDAQAGGHSLALSVCRSIIEAHEGSLRIVDGRVPASRFEIELARAGHS